MQDRLPLRATHSIHPRQARNSRPAILRAEELGLPLNQLVTINFTAQSVSEERLICLVLEKIRRRYCRWAKEPGKKKKALPFTGTMIWVLENTGCIAAHLMLHVPEGRLAAFEKEVTGWVAKYTGQPLVGSALDIRPIYNPHGLRKYLLKGLDPIYGGLYRVRTVPQGRILGKRMGYTKNLGPSQCLAHRKKRSHYRPSRGAHDGFSASAV